MRHLVIGPRQKAPNFSANFLSDYHWGQHFVTTRVVHLLKRTETSLISESDQSRANHQLLQLYTVCTAWSESDQAVRAVHSCKSWFFMQSGKTLIRNAWISWLTFEVIVAYAINTHYYYTNLICLIVSHGVDISSSEYYTRHGALTVMRKI